MATNSLIAGKRPPLVPRNTSLNAISKGQADPSSFHGANDEDKTPANIIICVDGTGNNMHKDDAHKETNVARISRMFKPMTHKGGRAQSVLYQPGIGTESDWPDELKTFDNYFDRVIGAGVEKYICTIYAYISAVWKPGDNLFFFGFSRGAYVARLIASLVADVGILDRHTIHHPLGSGKQTDHRAITKLIYKDWMLSKGGPVPSQREHARHMRPAEISFLGVFDTVASIGVPDIADLSLQSKQYVFAEQIDSRPAIKRAYHAIALSEHRENFKCVLFNKSSQSRSAGQTISQVWFPGYHTCAGGGTGVPGNTIPNVSLVWMVSKFKDLLEIDEEVLLAQILTEKVKPCLTRIEDSKTAMYAANGDHYRVELGSGVNEALHQIVEQGHFGRYTGIQEMPNIRGTKAERVNIDLLKAESPSHWEKKMLKVMAGHIHEDSGHGFSSMMGFGGHGEHGPEASSSESGLTEIKERGGGGLDHWPTYETREGAVNTKGGG
ncbi:hypothetical protein B0H66DRAFT_586444 [Apodospora peruviana]|uniref:T6SS Phospholipase effector Tle1-like catalytic domain-containing protein n=1 Tax=Apodospora peruviana TaxID=516989 RepID=A0AAE0MFQ6_9PEZI|nr:hypothetical protein B0H66DRAFT_586444 [Apodospora peruviana]